MVRIYRPQDHIMTYVNAKDRDCMRSRLCCSDCHFLHWMSIPNHIVQPSIGQGLVLVWCSIAFYKAWIAHSVMQMWRMLTTFSLAFLFHRRLYARQSKKVVLQLGKEIILIVKSRLRTLEPLRSEHLNPLMADRSMEFVPSLLFYLNSHVLSWLLSYTI